ncbi:FAS1 domain-containing protein [Mycena indigotica]|uniref:FAS1 domain-containing protein n=1 Tax=Mycena indigotica TaxID=2126181 RepID=A0A8H6VYA8_9AGAR|nr:FAS1 domain-containing protein [Mycena indigotica]KAF7294693.1 FAS1 domain-containing protein [Mycena indigotica]
MQLRLCTLFGFLLPVLAQSDQQIVINQPTTMKPTIADLLTIESSLSIFYGYARELHLSNTFSDSNAPEITVLAPTNKAVMALARKPHQDPVPADDGVIITEEEFDAKSKENVQRWISAHIIPHGAIQFDDQTYDTLLDGKSLTFSSKKGSSGPLDWSHASFGDDIHIVGKREAANGIIYLIDGTVLLD